MVTGIGKSPFTPLLKGKRMAIKKRKPPVTGGFRVY
jgi:hypothetical protein